MLVNRLSLLVLVLLAVCQGAVGQRLLNQFPVAVKATALTAVAESGKTYTLIQGKGNNNLMLIHGDSFQVSRTLPVPAKQIQSPKWTLVGGIASEQLVEWIYYREKEANGYGGNQIAALRYDIRSDTFQSPQLLNIPFDHCSLLGMQNGSCWLRVKSRSKHHLVALQNGHISIVSIKNTPLDTIFRSAALSTVGSLQPNMPLLPLASSGTERVALVDSGRIAIISIQSARQRAVVSFTIVTPAGAVQQRNIHLPELLGTAIETTSTCAISYNAPFLAVSALSRTGFQCAMLDMSTGLILMDQNISLSSTRNDETLFSGFWEMKGTDQHATPVQLTDTVRILRKLNKGTPGISIARYPNGTLVTFGSYYETADAGGTIASVGTAILAGLAFGIAPVVVPIHLKQVYGQVFVSIDKHREVKPLWTGLWQPVYLPTSHTIGTNQWFFLGSTLVRQTVATSQDKKAHLVWLAYS